MSNLILSGLLKMVPEKLIQEYIRENADQMVNDMIARTQGMTQLQPGEQVAAMIFPRDMNGQRTIAVGWMVCDESGTPVRTLGLADLRLFLKTADVAAGIKTLREGMSMADRLQRNVEKLEARAAKLSPEAFDREKTILLAMANELDTKAAKLPFMSSNFTDEVNKIAGPQLQLPAPDGTDNQA